MLTEFFFFTFQLFSVNVVSKDFLKQVLVYQGLTNDYVRLSYLHAKLNSLLNSHVQLIPQPLLVLPVPPHDG